MHAWHVGVLFGDMLRHSESRSPLTGSAWNAVHLDGLKFFPKYGLNAGVLLSRLDRLRRSNFTVVREQIIAEWGPGGRGLLYLGDQARLANTSNGTHQSPFLGAELG